MRALSAVVLAFLVAPGLLGPLSASAQNCTEDRIDSVSDHGAILRTLDAAVFGYFYQIRADDMTKVARWLNGDHVFVCSTDTLRLFRIVDAEMNNQAAYGVKTTGSSP